MKSKFWYLTSISLKRKIKTKWFLIANILLAVAIIAVTNIDLIINFFGGDFNDKTNIYVIDNTNSSYDLFNSYMQAGLETYSQDNYNISKVDDSAIIIDKIKNDEKENNSILLIINNNSDSIIEVEMISNDYVETIAMNLINSSVNGVKTYLAAIEYELNENELLNLTSGVVINRTILDETKDSAEENMTMIMTTVFPIVILPFFMLVLFLVQMIGAEVNDEKTTRGMEIIISNVSPQVHFFSKCLAGNVFILFQSFLLILYMVIALFVRSNISVETSSIGGELTILLGSIFTASFVQNLKYVIPLIIILMILNFIAYSLLAGILASMTTNTEDFQQLQTPIMLFNLVGYYLAIMAGTFKGSIFIKIFGYIPFISAILSPSLYVLGQFTILDILISIILSVLVIYLLIKYGLRIYKVGILNYSSGNLWKKMFAALKNK